MFHLLAATAWFDVCLPLLVGLVLCIRPSCFVKSSGSEEKDQARLMLMRKCGALLLVVAGIYFVATSVGS